MRSKFLIITAVTLAIACTASVAQAEPMMRCQLANGQWAMCRAPGHYAVPRRRPVIGLNINLGGWSSQRRVASEQVVQSEGYQSRQDPNGCDRPGSIYAKEIGTCILKVRDQARIDREVPNAHMDHDPNCAGKPSGYVYTDPNPIETNGMQGLVRRRCR